MLGKNAKVELLRKVPLFAGCSKSELRELALVADEVQLGEGTVLTKEGSTGREFFVLVDGAVQVARGAGRSPSSVPATGSARSRS